LLERLERYLSSTIDTRLHLYSTWTSSVVSDIAAWWCSRICQEISLSLTYMLQASNIILLLESRKLSLYWLGEDLIVQIVWFHWHWFSDCIHILVYYCLLFLLFGSYLIFIDVHTPL